MRRHRTVHVALATLALGISGALVAVGWSQTRVTPAQGFQKALLDDAKTTPGIKALLRDRGGFAAPEIEFADLTGDGRSDAVVLVDTGGAGGVLALYVFSTHGRAATSALRAVYRSQQLYRAHAEIEGATLTLTTPRFAEGDDLCCPSKVLERTYMWSASAKTLKQATSEERPGPTGTTTPAR